MRCLDAQKQSSQYLDSELSSERSAAVRGHLRLCDTCRESFEMERELIDAAADLPTLDPPDSIWEGVQARIAKEEVKDSLEWPLGRWLRIHWRPALGFGMAVAIAASIWVVRPSDSAEPKNETAVAPAGDSERIAQAMEESYAQLREEELAEADRHYMQTIADLREMLEEDRALWSESEVAAVDAQLAVFRKDAIGTRFGIENGTVAVESRDALYANYRSEIGFLQSALAGDLPRREP